VLAGQLLLAAGDFIHGIHGLFQRDLLAYSTASLAKICAPQSPLTSSSVSRDPSSAHRAVRTSDL